MLNGFNLSKLVLLFLRPTPLAGSNSLAQSTRPRETRCKTSYAKRFVNHNVYIYLTRQGPRGWVLWKTITMKQIANVTNLSC